MLPRCHRTLSSTCLALWLGLGCLSLVCGSEEPTIPDDIKAEMQARVDYGYVPGMVLGVVDASGRSFHAVGSTSLEIPRTPDNKTLFEIGSISKVFTSTLLAAMVEAGEVTLDDPVSQWLPDHVRLPTHGEGPITLRHLATHYSGLPVNPDVVLTNSPLNPFSPFGSDDLYTYLGTLTLSEPPGSTFLYSNVGMGLLGHALSQGQDQTYGDLLRERVLQPLGMKDTALGEERPPLLPNRAAGYAGVVDRPPFAIDVLAGAGGLLSNADDLFTFLEHALGIRSSPLSSALASTREVQQNLGVAGSDIGLGWFISRVGNRTITMHDGATMGQSALIALDHERQIGVVALSNARTHTYTSGLDLALNVLIPARAFVNAPATIKPNPNPLLHRMGRYQHPDGWTLDVGMTRDHLTVSSDRIAYLTLYASSERRFHLYDAGVSVEITFLNQPFSNETTGLRWHQDDTTTLLPRIAIEPSLTAEVENDLVRLSIDAESLDRFIVERSLDLRSWSDVQESGRWDPPIEMPKSRDGQYFRLRRLSSP